MEEVCDITYFRLYFACSLNVQVTEVFVVFFSY